jgi:hypothetical protein
MGKGMGHRVMVYMSKRMMACDEASFLISYQQDNRLGLKQWWQLKMHLLSCHLCRKYAIQIEEMNHSMGAYRVASHTDSCAHHLSKTACDKMQTVVSKELNAK